MEKKYLDLHDLQAYNVAYHLSNDVWHITLRWDYFAKDTIGKQFVRAIDSISANIAEGFGRYNKKDKIHFYRYSYGSIQESRDWSEKAKSRKLLSEIEYNRIASTLSMLRRELHALIKFTNEKLTI